MKLNNVNIDSGLQTEPFLSTSSISEIQVRNSKRYFQSIEREPLIIPVSFAFTEQYDSDLIRSIARWLSPSFYCPFKFSDNYDAIFYAIPIESSELITNGLKEGYLNLNFRCDTYHAYGAISLTSEYVNTATPTTISIENTGGLSMYPIVYITKSGDGDISIVNNSNGGIEFKFTSLSNGEVVTVDCENEIIETSLAGTYRYSNFNDNYLELIRGVNSLLITGEATIQFKLEPKLLQW